MPSKKQKKAEQRLDLVEQLADATIADLLRIIRDGSATAADRNVARALMRDAGVQIGWRGDPTSEMTPDLVKAIEEFEDEDFGEGLPH